MSDSVPQADTVTESAPISLDPISKDHASVLRNLFELYVYDFSEQLPLTLKPSGLFEVRLGDEWWSRDDHFPFFIRRATARCSASRWFGAARVSRTPAT